MSATNAGQRKNTCYSVLAEVVISVCHAVILTENATWLVGRRFQKRFEVAMSNQYVQTQVVCANCAAIRGESNHWYAVWLNRLPELTSIRVSKWNVESGAFPHMLPACGELCLLRLVAKNLEKL